jgi:hypothetical protein
MYLSREELPYARSFVPADRVPNATARCRDPALKMLKLVAGNAKSSGIAVPFSVLSSF